MAGDIIRPSLLPDRPSPVATEKVPVDNGVTVGGATIQALVYSGRPAASQVEAEAGVDAAKAMTPLTTKQSIASEVGVSVASKAQGDKADTAVQTVVAGTNVTVDSTDPLNPIVSAALPAGAVASVTAGDGIFVDNTDPTEPVVGLSAALPQGRLSVTSGVGASENDVTGAATVYYVPSGGSVCPIYDGSSYVARSIGSGLSLALDSDSGHTGYHQSAKNFDLFAINDAGTIRLGTGPSWDAGAVAGSATARGTGAGSTELETYLGVIVNKNTITIRFGSSSGNTVSVAAREATYVGSFRATANGQASDTKTKRFLFNAYNQMMRHFFLTDAANSWTYTGALRQANANAANQVEFLLGLAGTLVEADIFAMAQHQTSALFAYLGVGLDSTTTLATESLSDVTRNSTDGAGVGVIKPSRASYKGYPSLGYHRLTWLEGSAGGNVTWFGTNSDDATRLWRSGMNGKVLL